ncbi:phosphoglucosamine mutase [Pseudobacteriovorax antillogorgiicola]|uniref:Phosphoglucosamine mutase n=1 Tax=Pseudobacteriovorax antillogorgiicola TaxID=1513793 RepID=A0A1Y6CJD0_9BACT|nr:phosphoglucosamine mutase [Pseudobacteriovorax antillogorgiicola]TCS46159.1 phosphoglucosamine mutase [Pseudobacteriovorax antillogorgiicola]SMF69874.1 phosphoglucosamine mutase [Pseudobacteriovorax antillogorgiicola]
MGKYFGTDGIRGKANVHPMSPDFVLRLGQAIGIHFRKAYPKPKILIGKDTRRSGYMLEQALSSGICSVGVDVGFLGPLPTPGIAYLTRGMRACAGIVISASHNPFHDNGIKIFSDNGFKLPDEIEDKLESLLELDPILDSFPVDMQIGNAKRIDDAVGQYAVFLKEQFPKHLTLEGMRIVLDCANGAAYKVAPKVFEELGAELFVVGDKPDGRNINDQCGALHPQKVKDLVKLYKADIGLAFDGDADRLIVVDDTAEIIDGDQIMAICASYMKKAGRLRKSTVVATVMSNMGLDIAMKSIGVKLLRTKVGDRYVVDEMRRGGYNLGGEQSGHMVFSDSSTTGDGILAALHLLEIVQETKSPLSEHKKCMEVLPQVLKNVKVSKKVPLEELPKVKESIAVCETKLGTKGRVLFRYSGTENLARIMLEGEDSHELELMAREIADSLQNSTN